MTIKFLMVSAIDNRQQLEEHHPPLGLGYIASSLRRAFGNRVQCKVVESNFVGVIKIFKPDIIGITSVTRNYNVAKQYALIAGQVGIPVIIGGVHVSFMPQTMTSDMVVGIVGEGEGTVVELLSSYLDNGRFVVSELYEINGIVFKDNGRLVQTKPRDLIRPLDDIPYPDRGLIKIGKMVNMISSRGCPYNCVFCSTARHTKNQVRYASADYVVEEIEQLYTNYNIEYITIYDDLFAINNKRVLEMQKLMSSKNLIGKFRMAVNIRPDFITDELAEILHDMNVDVVALGVESGCQKTLDYLKSGGITVEANARAIRILKKHHIIPYCSFIFGSPSEDWAAAQETVKFIKGNGINYFDTCVLVPFPGTPLWEYALSRGLVGDDMDWSRLEFRVNSDSIILSDSLSRSEIIGICSKLEARKRHYLRRLNIWLAIKQPRKYVGLYLEARKNHANSPRS